MKTPGKKIKPNTRVVCGSMVIFTPVFFDPKDSPAVIRMLKQGSCVPVTPDMFSDKEPPDGWFVD